MSNGIAKRENEEKSIKLLAAQRKLYKEVGRLNSTDFFLSVIFPIVVSAVSSLIIENKGLYILKYLTPVAIFFLSRWISYDSSRKRKLAAEIQQEFDTYVFQMSWDKSLFGDENKVKDDVIKYLGGCHYDDDKNKLLTDWYAPSIDQLSLEDGINACQRENINWDSELRKKCKKVIFIIGALAIFFLFFKGALYNETVRQLLIEFYLYFPIFKWLYDTHDGLRNDIQRLDKIYDRFMRPDEVTMHDLQFTQQLIYEHRKEAIKLPDVIYEIFRENDENREKNIIDLHRNWNDSNKK